MKLPIHIVDAFASEHFTGNPAAVVLFGRYPEDALLQAIAAYTAGTAYQAFEELDRGTLDGICQGHPRVKDVLQAFCEHRMASDEWLARRAEGAPPHAGS